MTQQVRGLPSKFRKGFLVVGIGFLILGFVFFYEAGQLHSAQVTTYKDAVNLADSTRAFADNYSFPQWGLCYDYVGRVVFMQPNDFINVSYPESTPINGTIHIVVTFNGNSSQIAAYSDFNSLSFVNNIGEPWPPIYKTFGFSSEDVVGVLLVTQNIQNATVSLTTELNHYETPQWVYFGIGVLLTSLAMISVFKSKK